MRKQAWPETVRFSLLETPIGWLAVARGAKGLVGIETAPDRNHLNQRLKAVFPQVEEGDDPLLEGAVMQLQEFFNRKRTSFDLPLDFSGLSPFARKVLTALQDVGPGCVVSCGELAARAGHPGAARAVGRVMARNPFPVVIPCHRVVGAGGEMTGYSGGSGIPTKMWLLEFERNSA